MCLQNMAQNYDVSELARSSGETAVSFAYLSLENAISSLGTNAHQGQLSRAAVTCGG